jgi:predicted methyltransferase
MKTFIIFGWLLYCLLITTTATAQFVGSTEDSLSAAIAGTYRTSAFKARDKYRHPKETLSFFGLRPDMRVVEIWPGLGWYTEILAPFLRDHGVYYAAHSYVDDKTPLYAAQTRRTFMEKLAKQPLLYDRVVVTAFGAPEHVAIAPGASIDLVLTFRNVHNWVSTGTDEAAFRAFYDVLRRGGVLGVVEHRARQGTSLSAMKRTGYITEAYVIALAEKVGFRLVATSEINANTRDTKDYPEGVWTLPPSLRLGDADREKYLEIGESDRMTLKFQK